MLKIERRGRKRKIGIRWANGNRVLPSKPAPFPGKSAVYVIELADGIVKIGRSQNPQERIKDLLVGHERPAALICCFWMADAEAVKVESKVHKKLRTTDIHARGEMYYLDAETAIAMIKAIIGKRPMEAIGIEYFAPEVLSPRPKGGQATRRRIRNLWTLE